MTHAQRWGPTVILSDGDAVFQPRKVERSGLWRAVEDRVLIYIHKESELADVERFYPARHYVLIDDKLRILAAVKSIWHARVTTVFVRQGHYAHDGGGAGALPFRRCHAGADRRFRDARSRGVRLARNGWPRSIGLNRKR